jgi:Tol biopolymer transport system component
LEKLNCMSAPVDQSERVALHRICASPEFAQSERMRSLLVFLVETVLEGRGAELKETVIGVAVFRRDPSYDPKGDPVVGTEARRLRLKLAEYYAGSGSQDALRIELPKGGYIPRFSAMSAPPAEPGPLPASRPKRRAPGIVVWISCAGLLIVAAILFAPSRYSATRARIPRPLTNKTGNSRTPRFSRDGKYLAYSVDSASLSHIYFRPVEGGAAEQVTTGPRLDYSPAWSPDGKQIAFLRQTPSAVEVRITTLDGKSDRLLSSVAIVDPIDWSPDGKFIAVADRADAASPLVIVLLSPDTGARRVLTAPALGTLGDRYPRFSPDGRSIAFRRSRGDAMDDVFVTQLDRPADVLRLTHPSSSIAGHCWWPDGHSVVVSTPRADMPHSLWRFPLSGGTPLRVPDTGAAPADPDMTAAGEKLAFVRRFADVNIWRASSDGSGEAEMVAESGATDSSPAVSPDGFRVAFRSNRTDSSEIWVWDARGDRTTQLTHARGPVTGSPNWSPDGSEIVFDSRPGSNADIYRVAAAGGAPVRLTTDPANDVVPRWSHDGQFIYFASDRSGQLQVWRMRADGGAQEQVTWNGGFAALESADGKFLYYSKRTPQGGIWRLPLSGGPEELMVADLPARLWGQWTLGKDSLYYVHAGGPGPRAVIRALDLLTRAERTVRAMPEMPPLWDGGVAAAPDGRTLYFTQLDHSGSDIYLVE